MQQRPSRLAPYAAGLVLTGLGISHPSLVGAQTSTPATTPTVTTPTAPATPAMAAPPTVAGPSSAPPAPKETPVAPAPYINVTGEIDGYYQYQFSDPKGTGILRGGRIYAIRHDTPAVRLAWADIYHTPAPGGFGFKVSLATGDAADRDVPAAQSGVGESRYKHLAQFYGTYTAANGFTVDIGKYLSPYGYDTTETTLNYNYTLTDATYLVPNYVFGARATYPFKSPNLAASVYVVNSLEEAPNLGVEDDGNNHDVILRLNYTTPDGKFNYIPAYGFGRAKLTASGLDGADVAPAKGNEDLVLFDNWLTYHATRAITIAGEYVYRKDDNRGGNYNRKGDGYGAYYRQQLDSRNAIALRYSALTSHTDVIGGAPLSTTSFRADEYTATYEYRAAANFLTRTEFRHDHSNDASAFGFDSGSNPAPVGSQDALIVAGIFTY